MIYKNWLLTCCLLYNDGRPNDTIKVSKIAYRTNWDPARLLFKKCDGYHTCLMTNKRITFWYRQTFKKLAINNTYPKLGTGCVVFVIRKMRFAVARDLVHQNDTIIRIEIYKNGF